MKAGTFYCCTEADCNQTPLLEHDDALCCNYRKSLFVLKDMYADHPMYFDLAIYEFGYSHNLLAQPINQSYVSGSLG